MANSWVKLILQPTICSNYRVAILAKFVTPNSKSDKNGDKVSRGLFGSAGDFWAVGLEYFAQNWWMLATCSLDSQFEILWNFLIRSCYWLLLWRIFAMLLPVVFQLPSSPYAFRASVFIGTKGIYLYFMQTQFYDGAYARAARPRYTTFIMSWQFRLHRPSQFTFCVPLIFPQNSCRVFLFSRLSPIPGQQCQRRRIVLIEWIEAFTSCLIIRIVHSWNAMNGKPFTRINVRCSFVRSLDEIRLSHGARTNFPFHSHR